MGARYYDFYGQNGRFLSADPLGNSASMDLYSYAGNDPINNLDPNGRSTLELSGAASAVASASLSQPNPMTLKQEAALQVFDLAATTGNYFSGNTWSQPASDQNVTAYQMFYEWDKGTGSSSRTFGANSTMGQEMLQSDYVQAGINTATTNALNGNFSAVPIGRTLNPPGLTEFQSIQNDLYYALVDFPGDIGANPFMTPNPARGLQGSIAGSVTPELTITAPNGPTLVFMNIILSDQLTATSATHGPPSVGGYNIPNINDPSGANGKYRTITTNYDMNFVVPIFTQ
jgi:hypothetical protein